MEIRWPDGETAPCAVCSRKFSRGDMLCLEGKWVCGDCKQSFVQMLQEGLGGADATVAREKRVLVMGRNALLPDRCVKCNAPAKGRRLKRDLYWHNPLIYVFLFANILIYALIAMVVRRKASVEVGLCEKHYTGRRTAIAVAWGLVLAAAASIAAGATAVDMGYMVGVGMFLLIAGLIYAAVKTPVVSARKIDKEYVWVNGVCKDYLALLPEWEKPE